MLFEHTANVKILNKISKTVQHRLPCIANKLALFLSQNLKIYRVFHEKIKFVIVQRKWDTLYSIIGSINIFFVILYNTTHTSSFDSLMRAILTSATLRCILLPTGLSAACPLINKCPVPPSHCNRESHK